MSLARRSIRPPANALLRSTPLRDLRAPDSVIAAGNSRIYAGIHYRFDIENGQALGRAVAGAAMAYDRARGLLAAVR